MNPARIRAANYRTFDQLALDLPEGVCAIVGPNGAGKSSIVNAIDLALFGPQSRSLADCHSHDAIDDLLLELEFEHAGELYRVRRTYSPRGRGRTTVDFEACDDDVAMGVTDKWVPLTRESTRETDALISSTIGLTRETFRASAFVMQGDSAAFTEAQPRDRKRILCDVLQLDRWATYAEHARDDRRRAEAELQRLNGVAEAARIVVATREQVERDHQALATIEGEATRYLAAAEAELEQVSARFLAAREASSALAAAEAELQTARTQLEALQLAAARTKAAATQIQVARDELATLRTQAQLDELLGRGLMLAALQQTHRDALADRDAALAAAREALGRRNDLLSLASELNEKAHTLREHAERLLAERGSDRAASCDRCGQTLGFEAATTAATNMRAEADALDADAAKLDAQAKAIEIAAVPETPAPPTLDGDTVANHLVRTQNEIAAARADQQQRARLEERIAACQQQIAAEPDLADRLVSTAALVDAKTQAVDELEPVDLATIESDGQRARARVADERERLARTQTEKARIEERLERISEAEQQLADAKISEKSLQAEVDLTAQLERAFGPSGIPALILENAAIPQLETTANELLRRLGGKTAGASIELRTQAENKDGSLRDALDVVVVTETGAEQAYESWSGGERMRINLALRLALAQLLAHRRGAESRIFAVDEPDGLDAQGKQALIEILHAQAAKGMDRVYLISHDVEIRDAFEQTLAVRTDGARSWVDGAREQVLA